MAWNTWQQRTRRSGMITNCHDKPLPIHDPCRDLRGRKTSEISAVTRTVVCCTTILRQSTARGACQLQESRGFCIWPMIEGISAITLGTHDMARAVRFYRAFRFDLLYGGEAAAFTSFRAGSGYLNLTAQPEHKRWSWWGRVIFCVADVDTLHAPSVGSRLPALDPAARCRVGRALLPQRSRRPRTQLRAPVPLAWRDLSRGRTWRAGRRALWRVSGNT